MTTTSKAISCALSLLTLAACTSESTQQIPLAPRYSETDAMRAIATSPRVAQIASQYLALADGLPDEPSERDLVQSIEHAVTRDSLIAAYFDALAPLNIAPVRAIDGGYIVNGEWQLSATPGSAFDAMFPLGGRILISGELALKPKCSDGGTPALLYGELTLPGAQPFGAAVTDMGDAWLIRLNSKAPDVFRHRIIVDGACNATATSAEPASTGEVVPAEPDN